MKVTPPLNYTGSKLKYLGDILPLFPQNVTHFAEPFFGGGAVGYNVECPRVFANDILEVLIRTHQALIDLNANDFISRVKTYAPHKEDQQGYNELRAEFNERYWNDPFRFFALLQSCTNNMIRYNKEGGFNQTHGKRTITPTTERKIHDFKRAISSTNTSLEFRAWPYEGFLEWILETLPVDDTFVFFDPPYLISEAGYNAFWTYEMESNLYEWLHTLDEKGYRWGMTNFELHKGKRNSGFDRISKYNKRRINTNYGKVSRKNVGETTEWYVCNYPIPANTQAQTLFT